MSGHRRHLLMAAVVLAAVALFTTVGDLPDVDVEKFLQDLAVRLGSWTYLLVGGLAFLETGAFIGLVAPGEFAVILGGVVAGQGEISVFLLLGVVWFAAWAGDSVSFALGARLGRGFIMRHGRRMRLTPERFAQVEGYFADHGGKTILIGRFIGLVRALAPFIAGSSGMRYRAFVPFCILGTGLWASVLVLLGYFFSQSLDTVVDWVGKGFFAFGAIVFAVVGIVMAVRFLRVPANRARLSAYVDRTPPLRWLSRLFLRPFWAIVRPEARFLAARLTPGKLGLEFSTVLAVLAVGVYVLALYIGLLSGQLGATAGDRIAFDVSRELAAGWLTDLARGVTRLGAGYLTWVLAAVASVWLVAKRRWAEVAVLAIGLGITIAGVSLLKEAIDRPRPSGGLVPTQGDSFPSGHAAYSTLYPVLAVTVARVAPPLVARVGFVTIGLAIAAAVGLSRVYLRAHYFSDVLGGWALGAAAFGACAAVALIVTYLRQNERDERDPPPGDRVGQDRA